MINYVTKRNGEQESVDFDKINRCVAQACEGLEDVSTSSVVLGAKLSLYEGIKTSDIDKAMILGARSLIETEPNYSFVAARLLLNSVYKEVFGISTNGENFDTLYRAWFIESLEDLEKEAILSPKLLTHFDLDDLAATLDPSRDRLFKYLGLQTLVDRYLKRDRNQKICQTPQMFHMVVAMGLSVNENDRVRQKFCKELYESMSTHCFSPSTPTLFNSGTVRSQLSSCYLSSISDSLDGIMGEFHNQARLSKFAGGLGVDVTNIRGAESDIKSTNGKSSGIIPYAALFERLLLAFNQAGRRFGSGALYLEPWHIDVFDFLQLRKTTGDERRRAKAANTALWINDLLMEYKKTDRDWYLFSPDEAPRLHGTFGAEFKKEYEECVARAQRGLIRNFKVVSSKKLVKEMYVQYCETGHPFHCFKDSSNYRYMNKHAGIINSSNLCCVAGDQLVPTEKGFCTVKELYENETNNIVVGRENIENAGPMLLPRPNAEMLKITLRNGMTHKVTPDHPIWEREIGWKPASDFKVGDEVSLQSTEGPWGNINGEDLAFTLGVLCSTSHTPGDTRIELIGNESRFLPEIIEKLKTATGKKFLVEELEGKVVVFEGLSEMFDSLLFKDGKLKVPEFILKGNRKTVSSFLRGLFLVRINEEKYECRAKLGLDSLSEDFLHQLQIILLNYTIFTNVIYKKRIGRHKLFRIIIRDKRGLEIFAEETGLNKSRPELNFSFPGKSSYFSPVVKIENLPNEDAYCLTVNSKEHSWICNGFVTKNTEILEHTKPSEFDEWGVKTKIGETAVCTLNSINIIKHLKADLSFDYEKIRETTRLQVRCLDNAVDNNYYPTKEAEKSAKLNRQLGIGIMGFQEYLQLKMVAYGDPEAVEISGDISEWIALCAIEASIDLAKERGVYPNYEGSEWSKGKLPQDLYEEHYEIRFQSKPKYTTRYASRWREVRNALKEHGIRNGNLMAIAPTACVTGDTLVNTDKGRVRIDSLGDIKGSTWQDIDVNVEQENGYYKATKFYINGKQPCFKLTTKLGNTISCTENHRLRCLNKLGGYVWKYIRDFKVGDNVIVKDIGLTYDTITNIENIGEQETYDLSVPENNTYIANNFVSHNTISYILGVSQSIEPDYKLLYTYETLSGKFIMINTVFVNEMKKRGLWGPELIEALKKTDGDIKLIEGVPLELRNIFCTAFDQNMLRLIDCASERNIWIDQGQSFNLYYEGSSLKKVDEIITYAHDKLLKTLYYMRSKKASTIEKSTTRVIAVPSTTPMPEISSCSIDAMKRGEICESCQ